MAEFDFTKVKSEIVQEKRFCYKCHEESKGTCGFCGHPICFNISCSYEIQRKYLGTARTCHRCSYRNIHHPGRLR